MKWGLAWTKDEARRIDPAIDTLRLRMSRSGCARFGFHNCQQTLPRTGEKSGYMHSASVALAINESIYIIVLIGRVEMKRTLKWPIDTKFGSRSVSETCIRGCFLGFRMLPTGRLSDQLFTTSRHIEMLSISDDRDFARILDRNQMGQETSFCETRNIERDMGFTANQMRPAFWDTRPKGDSRQAYNGNLASQFWFFQAKVLLNSPTPHDTIHRRS